MVFATAEAGRLADEQGGSIAAEIATKLVFNGVGEATSEKWTDDLAIDVVFTGGPLGQITRHIKGVGLSSAVWFGPRRRYLIPVGLTAISTIVVAVGEIPFV